MTDGGYAISDLIVAAESAALALAKELGLGEEVRRGEDWSVDDGDVVLSSVLAGDANGRLVLAVNDAVADRLLNDAAVLEAAFAGAISAAAGSLSIALEGETVATTGSHMPSVIMEIIDAGVLTSLIGLTLPVAAPPAEAMEFDPTPFDDALEPAEPHAIAALSVLNDVELVVTAELGRTTMPVRELLGLTPGMVVEIDRVAGSPIDLLVNGRCIAAGEVVVIDEEFGIRITDIAPIGDRRR